MNEYPNPPYQERELRYAAFARCACGAGLAYAPNANPRADAWFCSVLLKDAGAKQADHDPGLPFAFWEIKSEIQPSANGATTRPGNADLESDTRPAPLTGSELLQTTDAQVWAKQFCARFGGDEGLMIGWFANAMAAQEMALERRARTSQEEG